MSDGFYYQLFQNATWWILSLPFCISLPLFVIMYRYVYIRHTSRVRTRQLVAAQSNWLKWCAVLLLLLLVPVVVYSADNFQNEFVRILISLSCYAYTYWAELHWLVRLLGLTLHGFVTLFMEAYFYREYLIQLACFQLGKCTFQPTVSEYRPVSRRIELQPTQRAQVDAHQ
jgi:hypothetical protein